MLDGIPQLEVLVPHERIEVGSEGPRQLPDANHLLHVGTPEQIAACLRSYTGTFLKAHLGR